MKRLILTVCLASASPTLAGNVANCEVMVADASAAGVAAGFMDAGPVVQSILDPEAPIIAAIDGRVVQAVMCTRRDPVPDAEDVPLVASGIPFILSTDFDSNDAPLVTLALDAEGAAVARMAVGLSERQQARLDEFLATYEPPQRLAFSDDRVEEVDAETIETGSSDEEAVIEEPEPRETDGDAPVMEIPSEELTDEELQDALDDLLSVLSEDMPESGE